MSPEPTEPRAAESLSEAEQAAAEAIAAVRNENGYGGIEHFAASDWEDEARAVVAAVGPILAAEALERFADKVDALPPGGEALGGAWWYRDGLRDAAAMARDEVFALRTTTPEKEN